MDVVSRLRREYNRISEVDEEEIVQRVRKSVFFPRNAESWFILVIMVLGLILLAPAMIQDYTLEKAEAFSIEGNFTLNNQSGDFQIRCRPVRDYLVAGRDAFECSEPSSLLDNYSSGYLQQTPAVSMSFYQGNERIKRVGRSFLQKGYNLDVSAPSSPGRYSIIIEDDGDIVENAYEEETDGEEISFDVDFRVSTGLENTFILRANNELAPRYFHVYEPNTVNTDKFRRVTTTLNQLIVISILIAGFGLISRLNTGENVN